MKQATIHDYARMCNKNSKNGSCESCPLCGKECVLGDMTDEELQEANEIILKWCKEHPAQTGQSELLKIFPNAALYNGVISVCPADFDGKFREDGLCCNCVLCTECKKEYWLAEVDENE